jgi:hypothetical protein
VNGHPHGFDDGDQDDLRTQTHPVGIAFNSTDLGDLSAAESIGYRPGWPDERRVRSSRIRGAAEIVRPWDRRPGRLPMLMAAWGVAACVAETPWTGRAERDGGRRRGFLRRADAGLHGLAGPSWTPAA